MITNVKFCIIYKKLVLKYTILLASWFYAFPSNTLENSASVIKKSYEYFNYFDISKDLEIVKIFKYYTS